MPCFMCYSHSYRLRYAPPVLCTASATVVPRFALRSRRSILLIYNAIFTTAMRPTFFNADAVTGLSYSTDLAYFFTSTKQFIGCPTDCYMSYLKLSPTCAERMWKLPITNVSKLLNLLCFHIKQDSSHCTNTHAIRYNTTDKSRPCASVATGSVSVSPNNV